MAILVLLLALILALVLLLLGGVFAEPIAARIRRRVPNFSYEGETFLLWGLFFVAAFALGLVVMYLVLKP